MLAIIQVGHVEASDRYIRNKVKAIEQVQESPLTGITYDLGDIGLIFFNRSRSKETYWINLRKRV